VLCIQEHWYFSYEKNDLINISNAHETQAKSVDDYTEKENCIHGRGYGGVAIFWRKDIDHAMIQIILPTQYVCNHYIE
jgi:hypothetical protein